ncbi:hypothetical protein F7725_004824 [Dissostichus mawsoni]|uniref:Peptidase S1 domain-containing protein n=1 Tax=Dissostichus mawsoni TaxID=36200 RepID=A0A7J5XK65_DISMA|nr:hypothetical protein F7725_004824 [Dissostichus mawsoni]
MAVVLGLESMSGPNLNKVSKAIDKIILHPLYNFIDDDNDMALLKLSSPVNFTDYIQPVCLASANSTFTPVSAAGSLVLVLHQLEDSGGPMMIKKGSVWVQSGVGVDSDLTFVCPSITTPTDHPYPTTHHPHTTDADSVFGSVERVISSLGLLLKSLYALVGSI